ncbi:MAG: hypothetical protein ACXADF_06430 [Candidatus Thorarchaeota archaeon]
MNSSFNEQGRFDRSCLWFLSLENIEMMRATGLEDARLLLVERCGETSLRVTL